MRRQERTERLHMGRILKANLFRLGFGEVKIASVELARHIKSRGNYEITSQRITKILKSPGTVRPETVQRIADGVGCAVEDLQGSIRDGLERLGYGRVKIECEKISRMIARNTPHRMSNRRISVLLESKFIRPETLQKIADGIGCTAEDLTCEPSRVDTITGMHYSIN